MTKMVEYKGNHRIELGEQDIAGEAGARVGSYWFDIDNPRVEREFKRKIAAALRSLRAALMESTKCDEASARKKFDADYNKGTLFFREGMTNRAPRFIEYKADVTSSRWGFTAQCPTALEPLMPGFDLNALVSDMNV